MEQSSLEVRRDLIRIRVQILLTLFNKKVSDESLEQVLRVFCDALQHFPQQVIVKGFAIAEQECERFPTPKALREICGSKMPANTWRYQFEPSEDVDPETLMPVKVLLDPDPSCSSCREPWSAHPTKKCKEPVPSGLGDDRVMFRPQDCPEGRAFLAKFKEIAHGKET